MKRTISGGALLAAPLIIASNLFAGVAMADQTNVIALQLDAKCSDASTNRGVFAAQNKNDFPIEIDWTNIDNGHSGSYIAPANSFDNFATYYDPSDVNNTTRFTAEGWTSPAQTNVPAEQCDAATLATLPASSTSGSSAGSTSPTGGATTTTSPTSNGSMSVTEGGKGGRLAMVPATTATVTPVAKDTRASLADTGASRILPYSAAAMIAVATLGMTVAVRKNLL